MTTTNVPRATRATAALLLLVLPAAVLIPASSSVAAPPEPKVQIASVKTAQVAKNTTRSTVMVRVDAPRTGKALRVRVRVNPTGKVAKTGKTITRTVKARWSKGAYRAKVKIRTGGPGKVIAWATVGGKKLKATRKSPGKVTTKLTGWDPSRTIRAGATLTDTVKVTPARGRKVLLQERVAGKWVTRQTSTAKTKTAKVNVTLTGPTATGPVTSRWRVRVPATAHAKAVKTSVRVLTRDNITTPKPPTPEPDPDHPGWPKWCGTDIWGSTPLECYRPTISTVLDRWTYNPRCYHQQECYRKFDPSELLPGEQSTTVFRWGSDGVWGKHSVNWKPLAAPDFLDHLNAYRQTTSVIDGRVRHVLRPAPWSITVDGYTVPGQGGHPQMWAMHLGENGGGLVHSDYFERNQWINERYPDARGHWWACTENVSKSSTSGSSKGLFAWASSPGHRSALLDPSTSYSSFGAVIADSGSPIAVYQGCRLFQSESDWDLAYEPDGVTPAIWQPPAGWVAPSDG